jgi:hypothetical protein
MIVISASLLSDADCIPIRVANQHVDETKCVIGKVLRVKVGTKGVHFLDFCEYLMAPLTAAVFAADLKDVGEVRRLAAHTTDVSGARETLLQPRRNRS